MKKLIPEIAIFLFIFIATSFSQTEQDNDKYVQLNDTVFIMQKLPWSAVLRSAILPGWGQYYNESYWKIPIVWGVVGFCVYGWIFYQNNYIDFRDKYRESLINNSGLSSAYLRSREFYKDHRDLFAVYVGLTYFLNLVDAYVDAHLFDFDVSENPYSHSPQMHLKFYF